jgi:hypothetical protein
VRFMKLRWPTSFADTLGARGVGVTGSTGPSIDHNPQGTDPCEPAAPWLK